MLTFIHGMWLTSAVLSVVVISLGAIEEFCSCLWSVLGYNEMQVRSAQVFR